MDVLKYLKSYKVSEIHCRILSGNLVEKNTVNLLRLKPVFHLATLFARHKAKTRIRHRDWLILAGEKIRREQVGTVDTFLSVRTNKVAKWKTGLTFTVPKFSSPNTLCV